MSLYSSGPESGRLDVLKRGPIFFKISVRTLVPANCLMSFAKLASVNTINIFMTFLYGRVIVFFTMTVSSKALKAS